MTDTTGRPPDEVIELAELVNASLKDVIREYNGNEVLPSVNTNLGGWCGMGSYAYNHVARENGITSSIWYGEYKGSDHTWNVVIINGKSYIIDVTAKQFGLPDVNTDIAYASGCGYMPLECIKRLSDFDSWWDHEQPKPFLRRAVFAAIRRRQAGDILQAE